MANTPFKLKSGNVTPFKTMGSSPLKQDPLDLGLLDEAKKVKVSTMPKNFNMTGKDTWVKKSKNILNTKTVPKIKDVTGKTLTNIILKGDKLPAEKIAAKAVKETVKKSILSRFFKALGSKALATAGMYLGSMSASKADQPTDHGKPEAPGNNRKFWDEFHNK